MQETKIVCVKMKIQSKKTVRYLGIIIGLGGKHRKVAELRAETKAAQLMPVTCNIKDGKKKLEYYHVVHSIPLFGALILHECVEKSSYERRLTKVQRRFPIRTWL